MKLFALTTASLLSAAAFAPLSAQDQIVQNRPPRAQALGSACTGFSFGASISLSSRTVSEPIAITAIVPGGPADSIGLSIGDLISAINGHDVTTIPELGNALKETPATTRKLSVIRKDSTFTVSHTSGVVVSDSTQESKVRCARVQSK